jgi:anthranilate phosphoribosyltransferase
MAVESAAYDIRNAIRSVVEGRELTDLEAASAMSAIMQGEATDSQIAALVTGLRLKGETVSEIAGFARSMRDHAVRVEIETHGAPLLDTCGTGGDYANTFNISTTATFAIAASGVRIAKHGNRAASSACGSADLLEGLGVAVQLRPEQVVESVERVGVGFMFAPAFHPAMRFVGPTRREIGIRTIFNVLGPLTNPAGASHQLIGVGHPEIAGKLARVLQSLGSKHAVLVHAEEGLDEVGIEGRTLVTEWDERTGSIQEYSISPEDFGFERASRADIVGGTVEENVAITRAILAGEAGPRRTITLLNAGAGIYAADCAGSIAEGIEIAANAIDSGAALNKMDQLIAITQELTAAGAAA